MEKTHSNTGRPVRRMPWQRNVAAAVALVISSAAFADTGGLRITVNDSSGAPLPGATVKVSSPDSLVSKTAVTEADGSARLSGLDPATNYTVEVVASGFENFSQGNVAVVSGRNLSVTYDLGLASLDEVLVTGNSLAALDTTSAQVGTTITLDLTESLPTQRSYQSYLQLVPGVKPSNVGNPSSKSGVNYSDGLGEYGNSTDNVYYLDGVNVTDPYTGTFGANLNSEIIQEQQVVTGGVPAEYEGGAGLVSRVVTKSGGDEFSGSINYYLQNDKLVANNKHQADANFSTYDAAITLGGPIIKEKLWFFGSYQKVNREDDIADSDGVFMRTIKKESDLLFGKVTYQVSATDRVQATFFNDPTDISGSKETDVPNIRDRTTRQGGDNYKLEYSHDWNFARVEAFGYRHEAELSRLAANNETRNDVAFLSGSPTNAQLNLGGYGTNLIEFRNRDEFGLKMESLLSTAWGEHSIKAGFTTTTAKLKQDLRYTGPEATQYTSVAAQDAGLTFEDYISGDLIGVTDLDDDARDSFIRPAMAASADAAYYRGLLDSNNDGSISADELNAYQFSSTAGNPNGQVNVYRIVLTETVPVTFKTKGMSLYLQDSWTAGKWTLNGGLRGEQWKHYATSGAKIFTFDWTVAPRLSIVYDVNGDGSSKVWAFGGRYYDPIRHDMTSFAGNLTGAARAEQVFIGDRWLTFRTRGGATAAQQDAFFAPATKTPFTDELLVGYAKNLTRDLTASFTVTKRVSKNLLEDYNHLLYVDGLGEFTNTNGTHVPAEDTLFGFPSTYLGYDSPGAIPEANFFIGTLKGGKREYTGVEVSLQKQKSNHWQGLASYTYNDAKGNSMSDGNADYQGDVVWLDPRAPNVWAPQPGNIKHLAKLAGSYFFNNGLEFGAVFNWNSGLLYSKTFDAGGRHLPLRIPTGEAYEYGGVTSRWVAEGAIGGYRAPAVTTLDLRAKYSKEVSVGKFEAFLDVFNVFNQQGAYLVQDLAAGDADYSFGEGTAWTSPRRVYLGMRVSF